MRMLKCRTARGTQNVTWATRIWHACIHAQLGLTAAEDIKPQIFDFTCSSADQTQQQRDTIWISCHIGAASCAAP